MSYPTLNDKKIQVLDLLARSAKLLEEAFEKPSLIDNDDYEFSMTALHNAIYWANAYNLQAMKEGHKEMLVVDGAEHSLTAMILA